MKIYISKLENCNKVKDLIKAFEEAFPNLKFYYEEDANWIAGLVVRDKEDEFISKYELTSFNVTKIHYYNSGKNKFEEIISTDAIKKIYIRFMKKNFPEYREDYLKEKNNLYLNNPLELKR